MKRTLPPLRASRAFEAAARHCSFAQAGKELHLSAAAISQQVKVLEEWFGFPLFQRQHNSLELTGKGRTLLPLLKVAFDALSEATEAVRDEDRLQRVRIASYPNFAMKWLVPRLSDLRERMPTLEIEIITSSEPLLQLFHHVDLAIRVYEDAPQFTFDPLFSARLFPVAAPRLVAAGKRAISDPAELLEMPLLHLTHSPEDWRVWFDAAGVSSAQPKSAMWFDSHAVMIEAARRGLGVALGRSPFDDEAVANGRLHELFPLRVSGNHGWYVIAPSTLRSGRAAAVRDWLLAQRSPGAYSDGRDHRLR